MLADELRFARMDQAQLAAFKRAIEEEHHVKITFVSGGAVVRSDGTYVLRGALASSRRFVDYSNRRAQAWAEFPAYLEDANTKACHKALEKLGDILNAEDNLAW